MTARSGAGPAADADRDPADQADAAAHKPELITRLTRRRAASGLSQAGVARLMGTSQPAVARLESGRHDVQLSTFSKYAEALGLSLALVERGRAQAEGAGVGSEGEAAETPPERRAAGEQPPLGAPAPAGAGPGEWPGPEPMGSDPAAIPGMADLPDRDHDLTSRQRRVLEVIRASVERHGYPPSLREIGAAVGLTSASSVSYQLSILESKGYLRRDRGRARTVEVQLPKQAAVPPKRETGEDAVTGIPSPQTVQVPVYGQLPAAGLAVATEAIKDVFLLPRQVVGEENLFLLQVADKCMKRRGIRPGDWVVVRPQSHADEGDIVAARFDGQTIVRIFRRVGSHGFLMPSDKGHPQIPGAEASIRGKVVALLARFR